jgi:hypothetical protein
VMQENHNFGNIPLSLVHSALLTSSLYLLPGCISSQWQDLVHVLLAHPKVQFRPHDLFKLLLLERCFNWTLFILIFNFFYM